jgi:hypothetical protein
VIHVSRSLVEPQEIRRLYSPAEYVQRMIDTGNNGTNGHREDLIEALTQAPLWIALGAMKWGILDAEAIHLYAEFGRKDGRGRARIIAIMLKGLNFVSGEGCAGCWRFCDKLATWDDHWLEQWIYNFVHPPAEVCGYNPDPDGRFAWWNGGVSRILEAAQTIDNIG